MSVLAEHVARARPTAEQVAQLLELDPNSKLSIAAWEGMARGWPKDLTLTLSDDAQKVFRARYLAESTSIECKAAVLSVADKWSIRDLDQSVAAIQQSLFSMALDSSADADKRVGAWEQAVRLAPASSRVLDAVDSFFTPQLSPEVGAKAMDALQNARAEGLATKLLNLRKKLGPSLANSVIRLLLNRAETTAALLDAIEQGQFNSRICN